MAVISHQKKLEVAMLYLRGNTYKEIETKTEVSHGSISSIIKELLSGQLVIPGVPSDEVSDLHQLSVDLKKKGLEPSQALLGLTLFKKFNELGIEPTQFDQWSKLVKVFAPDDFPAKDFFEAALNLHKLEEAENKPFQEIAQEYASMLQKVGEIRNEVDSLNVKKKGLAGEVESLTSEVSILEHKKEEVKSSLEAESAELEQAKEIVAVAKEEHAQLSGEIKDLIEKKDELQSDLGTKGESLSKLKKIGLSEEDLLHLVKLLAGMAEGENVDADQVKDEFFLSLDQFKNYSGLQKDVQEEKETLQATVKQKASLVGEIEGLENRKFTLQAEIGASASGAAEQIHKAGEEAISSIQKQTDAINGKMKSVLKDTLETGLAVGKMMAIQQNSEESGKELEALLTEVKRQLGGK